jgi:rod shape-determining protein MreD
VAELFTVVGVTPDLPLIMTVLIAFARGPEAGCVVGFAAGLLQDVAGGGLVGIQALTKALTGFGVGLASGRLAAANPLVQVLALVVVTMAEGLARFGLLKFFHYPPVLPGLLIHVILPQALYNGAVGALCVVAMAMAELFRARASWPRPPR